MTKNHIGVLPASALIFCCRIFYLLTYSPRGPEYGRFCQHDRFPGGRTGLHPAVRRVLGSAAPVRVPRACPNCSTGRAGVCRFL